MLEGFAVAFSPGSISHCTSLSALLTSGLCVVCVYLFPRVIDTFRFESCTVKHLVACNFATGSISIFCFLFAMHRPTNRYSTAPVLSGITSKQSACCLDRRHFLGLFSDSIDFQCTKSKFIIHPVQAHYRKRRRTIIRSVRTVI